MSEPVAGAPAADQRELADLTRAVIDRLVRVDASPQVVARVAALLGEATDLLSAEPVAHLGVSADDWRRDDLDVRAFFRRNPVIGELNPLAPHLDIQVERGGEGVSGVEVVARTLLVLAYEGPPGTVHGGVIASLFDQLLSFPNIENRTPGFTARLTVHYRRPCPLDTDLVFRLRTDRVEGRKIVAVGELFADGVLCAEADGLFVSPEGAMGPVQAP